MAMFDDISISLDSFVGKARLFPLPNLVLFPHVMQPLHIFEPRYRELLEDAVADDHLLAMAVLAPGWEKNYEGRPPLYPMACLGQVTTHVRLADGTYNVLVLGLQRVRLLQEAPPRRLFRQAEVELCADQYRECQAARQKGVRRRLHRALIEALPRVPEAEEQLDQLLGHDVPLGVLTDVLSYMLDLDLSHKQMLLAEVDVYRRTEFLLSHLSEAAFSPSGSSAGPVGFPPQFSMN
jgi:Lon protease-like protein